MIEQVKNWMGLTEEEHVVTRANGQLQYRLDEDGVTLKYTAPEDSNATQLLIQFVNSEETPLSTTQENWSDNNGHFGIISDILPETMVFIPFGSVETELPCLRTKINLIESKDGNAQIKAFDLFEIDWVVEEYTEIKRWRPLLALCMAIAKAGGLNATKIAAVRTLILNQSGAPDSERPLLKEMMINEPKISVEDLLHLYFIRFPSASKKDLFKQLVEIARTTGTITSQERSIFRSIASELGIKGAKWQELSRDLNLYEEDPSADSEWDDGFFRQRQKREENIKEEKLNAELKAAYETLGISQGIDEENLRKAHRKLMKEFHPDKFSSKSEEEQILAAEKSAQFNEARDIILKHLKDPES